eukprot:6177064-Pleurochrysis_carterae.AAC.1
MTSSGCDTTVHMIPPSTAPATRVHRLTVPVADTAFESTLAPGPPCEAEISATALGRKIGHGSRKSALATRCDQECTKAPGPCSPAMQRRAVRVACAPPRPRERARRNAAGHVIRYAKTNNI